MQPTPSPCSHRIFDWNDGLQVQIDENVPEPAKAISSRRKIKDINNGGNGGDSEVVKRGRRGTCCRHYM